MVEQFTEVHKVNFLHFNQSSGDLFVATDQGFSIYASTNEMALIPKSSTKIDGGIKLACSVDLDPKIAPNQ
jgi:hypothetical protein